MIVAFVNRQQKHSDDFLSGIAGRTANAIWADCALSSVLEKRNLETGVTVHFVGSVRIRAINRETRGIGKTTDVLSFPMMDMKEGKLTAGIHEADLDLSAPGRPVLWLGDILVCPAKAEMQAKSYGHSLEREIAFLTAHGMLHLLGYDHMNPKEEKKMNIIQDRILNTLGYRRDSMEGENS